VPLVIGFIILIVVVVGRPRGEVVAILGSPFVALFLILMIVSISIHMRIGMQVIIEDYVHGEGLRVTTLAASTFFAVAMAAVSIFAILKLALGG